MSTSLGRERCGSTAEASLPATKLQWEIGCLANATRGEGQNVLIAHHNEGYVAV